VQNRAFIIHGWGGKPDEHWLAWLKEKMEERGFEVTVPSMPDTDEPVIDRWVKHLSHVVGEPDEQTYFVGHSMGCQTIMRYLETIPDKRVGGCVFIAGWFILKNLEDEEEEQIAAPWVHDDIDFPKVLNTTKNFIVLNSSDDDYDAVNENKKLFEQKLGARVTVLKNMGHFTEADGVTELPEVLEAIQEIASSKSH
jgi:uncharacterized protein